MPKPAVKRLHLPRPHESTSAKGRIRCSLGPIADGTPKLLDMPAEDTEAGVKSRTCRGGCRCSLGNRVPTATSGMHTWSPTQSRVESTERPLSRAPVDPRACAHKNGCGERRRFGGAATRLRCGSWRLWAAASSCPLHPAEPPPPPLTKPRSLHPRLGRSCGPGLRWKRIGGIECG